MYDSIARARIVNQRAIEMITERAIAKQTSRLPSVKTIQRWISKSQSKAIDGCIIDMNAQSCDHGCPNWLIKIGVME